MTILGSNIQKGTKMVRGQINEFVMEEVDFAD
jgi:hypothetical protein